MGNPVQALTCDEEVAFSDAQRRVNEFDTFWSHTAPDGWKPMDETVWNFACDLNVSLRATLAKYEQEKSRADAAEARLETFREIGQIDRGGALLILKERRRQIEVEGWTPAHDDEHAEAGIYNKPALPQAAAVYAVTAWQGEKAIVGCQNPGWPWDLEWFKPASPIRMLVKAGALIAAEIDRRLRAGEQP